jgi:hypothetical protein
MNLKIYLLAILISVSSIGFAQINGVVRGNVKDKNTQETIIGAVISVDGTTNGTTTDVEGNYKINLPVGTYNLKASYLGYVTLIQYNISVTSGNAQTVNFEIETANTQLNEVTVSFDKGKSAVRIYRNWLFVKTYPSSSALVSTLDIISSNWGATVISGLPPSYLDEIAVAVHYFRQVWRRRWL